MKAGHAGWGPSRDGTPPQLRGVAEPLAEAPLEAYRQPYSRPLSASL